MERVVLSINGAPLTVSQLLFATAALALALLSFMAASLSRAARRRSDEAAAALQRQLHMERAIAVIARQNAELGGRVRSVAEALGSRQGELARFVAERLDAVGARVGAGVEASGQAAGEQLAKLNERLAVIDAAQARLTGLTQEVVGLKEILANKQSRGAFGQGRLEAIISDALPGFRLRVSAYALEQNAP